MKDFQIGDLLIHSFNKMRAVIIDKYHMHGFQPEYHVMWFHGNGKTVTFAYTKNEISEWVMVSGYQYIPVVK